jgi:uncharacterized OsmC-like protein
MVEPMEQGVVVVRGGADGYGQEITAGRHRLIADEPVSSGGPDGGPPPYDLLMAAFGACTSMTIALYARRMSWPLEGVTVRLRHLRIHAEDCAECETKQGLLDQIERGITIAGDLTPEQQAKALAIADKCPVHRTLTSEIQIRTRLG